MNFATQLANLAARNGWCDRAAFHVGDDTWTHGAVHDLGARAATVLAAHGLGPGRRVLIALGDGIGWVAAFLGAARLGAVVVTANPLLTADDHRFMADNSEAALVVTGTELAERFDRGCWLDVDEFLRRVVTAAPAPTYEVQPEAPLYVQYTSGTTGRPRGAVHCHHDPAAYQRAVGVGAVRLRPDDVSLSVSKLFFAYGFGNSLVFPLFSGASAVLVPGRPSPAVVQTLADRHRVTVLWAVPSAYANLVSEGNRSAFSFVRVAVSGGEALGVSLLERTSAFLGAAVLDALGSTEVGHTFCATTVDAVAPGTVGRPLPGYEVELRDAVGNRLGDEAEGQLWVRGRSVMQGYLNRPQATAEALIDGWLCTADRAVRHRDGTYTHRGRRDDMEIVAGINVSPLEVERVLAEHPLVSEVAVAAVPDERGATRLRAFVVPGRPAADGAELESQLIALARERLAPFKVPRTVTLVPALPRTPTGKLRRFVVRQGAW